MPALTSSPNEKPLKKNVEGSNRELIQELRRENEEIKRLKSQLESAGVKGTATPQSAPPSSAEEGSTLPVLNILGIFAAAALGGYVSLQKKDAEQAQAAYEDSVRADQSIISGLRGDLGNIQNLLEQERSLVEKIKKESSVASAEYARQLSLEKAAKEAVEQERRLVERSLSSEQKLADALRLEAEKTSELLEAEKAAKFAADAEAKELKSQLEQVQFDLAEEKRQVEKWIASANEANQRLSKAQDDNETLENENKSLEEDIEDRQAKIEELNAAASALQAEIDNAAAVNASQNLLIERIGKETLSMREAMTLMRAQAAERALAAHNAAEKASAERAQLEFEAQAYREQISSEQQRIAQLESEISDAKTEILRANSQLASNKEQLSKAQETMKSMEKEIQNLNDKIAQAASSLSEEKSISSAMRSENVNLRSELASLQSDLSSITSNLAAEREEKRQILEAMGTLKDEYNMMSERVEAEQNTVASLRKEAADLRKTISELETKNKTLGSNLMQVDEQSRAKLAEVEKRLLQAEKNAGTANSAKEDAIAAIDKLENVIKMLQEDMQESQALAMAAQTELEAERAARSNAELSLEEMQEELQSIADAEEQARSDVQAQLLELRSEYDAAMAKLKELQAAKPRARAASAKTKTPKKELTEEEKEAKKRAAVEKRKATIARKKAEAEAAIQREAEEAKDSKKVAANAD